MKNKTGWHRKDKNNEQRDDRKAHVPTSVQPKFSVSCLGGFNSSDYIQLPSIHPYELHNHSLGTMRKVTKLKAN